MSDKVEMLQPLADLFQMTLTHFPRREGRFSLLSTVEGEMDCVLPLVADRMGLDMPVLVVYGRVEKHVSYILVKISGNLYVLASYAPFAEDLNVLLLNADVLSEKGGRWKRSEFRRGELGDTNYREVIDFVLKTKGLMVAQYYKGPENKWRRLDEAGRVDQRHGRGSEEDPVPGAKAPAAGGVAGSGSS